MRSGPHEPIPTSSTLEGTVSSTLREHARAAGIFCPEYPCAEHWDPEFEADRLDRAFAEEDPTPVTVRFELPEGASEADLDRLRVELRHFALRVPALRAREVSRIELRLDGLDPVHELGRLVEAVRREFPRVTRLPILAELDHLPDRDALAALRSAGCAHLFFEDVPASVWAGVLPELRALGFATIGARILPSDLGHLDGSLLLENGLDAIELRGFGSIPEEARSDEIGAALIARGPLESHGFVEVRPRFFRRSDAGPEPTRPVDEGSVLGFGPGAMQRAREIARQNTADLAAWAHAVDDGRRAPGRGIRRTARDHRVRWVVSSILNRGSIDPALFRDSFDRDLREDFAAELASLEALRGESLVREEDGRIELTNLGKLFAEVVAACFDREGRGRHPEPGAPTKKT